MKISLCGWFLASAVAAVALSMTAFGSKSRADDAPQTAGAGQLTDESLGNLLDAMGLEPKKEEKRYDFNFKALYEGEEWELTMSAVLSENGQSLWVVAWLHELPKSPADVPRTALLRLLALNDRMGKGKFFAYIAGNKRFVLQRIVDNQNISTTTFREILKDLGGSVVETYPHWSVANWSGKTDGSKNQALPGRSDKTAPAHPAASGKSAIQPRSARRSTK